ncbi:NADP-dependent oxidoreductase domain-containing protein [Mucidula mucida]|nr:NADP-dependent oxidoreductase domain-containing protein [Mucidula mucida]
MYSNGVSEVIIGKAVKQHNLPREKLVIRIKPYAAVSEDEADHLFDDNDVELARKGFVNQHGLGRKHIFDALDYTNFLQCHMQALQDVVQAGNVRYFSMYSCYYPGYAIQNRLTSFISMQNHYSLHFGVGSIPWSPLARVTLTRPRLEQIRRGKSVTAPIIGTSSPQNLEELVSAIHIKLSEEELKYLEEPYQPLHVFGYNQ